MSAAHKKLFWFLTLSVVIPFIIYTAYYYRQAMAVHYHQENFKYVCAYGPDTMVLLAVDQAGMEQARDQMDLWEQSVLAWTGEPIQCFRVEKLLTAHEREQVLMELKAVSFFQYPDTLSFVQEEPGGLPYRANDQLWYFRTGYQDKDKWVFWNRHTSSQNRRAQNLRRLSHFLVLISLENRE